MHSYVSQVLIIKQEIQSAQKSDYKDNTCELQTVF